MNSIKDMPVHNHPRDKLGEKDASALTDEELAAFSDGDRGVDVRTTSSQDPIFKLSSEMLYRQVWLPVVESNWGRQRQEVETRQEN